MIYKIHLDKGYIQDFYQAYIGGLIQIQGYMMIYTASILNCRWVIYKIHLDKEYILNLLLKSIYFLAEILIHKF